MVVADRVPEHGDGPLVGDVEGGHQVQGGRLAGARWPHQSHELAGGDREVGVVEDAPPAEVLDHPLEAHRLGDVAQIDGSIDASGGDGVVGLHRSALLSSQGVERGQEGGAQRRIERTHDHHGEGERKCPHEGGRVVGGLEVPLDLTHVLQAR